MFLETLLFTHFIVNINVLTIDSHFKIPKHRVAIFDFPMQANLFQLSYFNIAKLIIKLNLKHNDLKFLLIPPVLHELSQTTTINLKFLIIAHLTNLSELIIIKFAAN